MSNIFYEGQQVGCLMYGEGRVSEIIEDDTYPILVQYGYGNLFYSKDGKYHETLRPTLYPIEQYREIIANLPAPQPEKWHPKPGEWCWFWNQNSLKIAIVDKFKQMDGSDYINVNDYKYRNCAPFTGELPEHLKEVQP
jgi:hypothetical protein